MWPFLNLSPAPSHNAMITQVSRGMFSLHTFGWLSQTVRIIHQIFPSIAWLYSITISMISDSHKCYCMGEKIIYYTFYETAKTNDFGIAGPFCGPE